MNWKELSYFLVNLRDNSIIFSYIMTKYADICIWKFCKLLQKKILRFEKLKRYTYSYIQYKLYCSHAI